ncbi:hypothetical protein V8G54_033486 [Vigna mungo]|uniref:Transposase MuDR plant domain-containing protein n=1 Tax=Vigna mungo TaxID=3915 RepID=A0AAQ3RGD7_VIGMU
MRMINLARLNGQIHLFVVHLVSQPEIIYLLENVSHDIGQVEAENVMPDSGEGEYEKEGAGQCEQEGDGECEKEGGECEQQGDGDAECEQQGHGECEQQTEILGDDTVPVEEERCEGNGVVEGQIETQCEGDTATVSSWSSSGEDGNVDGNVHVNDDFMEDLVDYSDVDDGINTDDNRGLSDKEWESEELVSGAESDAEDDEESYGKFVTFTMPKSMVDYKWDLGTYFAQNEDLLDVIKTYAIENGRNIRYVKNDKKRARAKCMSSKGKCPWLAYFFIWMQ